MANAVKWTSPSAEIKIIEDAEPNAAATVTGTLDNTTNKDRWLDLQLKCQFASAPTAAAMAEISLIKYYINVGTGVWHADPNCVDNVGCITISPFDILKYENRKPCSKCTGVK